MTYRPTSRNYVKSELQIIKFALLTICREYSIKCAKLGLTATTGDINPYYKETVCLFVYLWFSLIG